jgi:hypothetical protein
VAGQQRVVVGVVQRVGVDHGGGQVREGVNEPVLGADRDRVRLDHRTVRVDQDRALGPEPAADPAQPDRPGAQHPGGRAQGRLGRVGQRRVDAVHQPRADVAGGLPAHGEDEYRDGQPDYGVGPGPAERHPARPGQHGQRGEPVGAGVPAVGHQRSGADPASGPDPVAGHQFVAREAENGRDGHGGQVADRPRVRQPLDGGERGHRAGDQDQGDDGHAGQVLGAAVAVGIAAGGAAPGEHEGHPERHRGQRVGRVVQRVAEQRNRPGQSDHHRLRGRRGGQPGQREPQRPPAVGRVLQRRVGPVVVRMRADRVPNAVPEGVPLTRARVVVVVLVLVLVAGLVAHALRMSDKAHRSTSTPATALLLRTLGRGGGHAPRPVR